jgi:UDP-N-acetylglucosamine 2-epimerase (non-hydrolysing)
MVSMKKRVAVVMGTRPEAVKLAPVVLELRRRGRLEPVVISTGQHREMLYQALAPFGVRPDIDLCIMQPRQTLYDVTERTLEGIRSIVPATRPSWVVVQGDTTTAFAAALAAFYEKIPVAHVEAGLRSGDFYSPYPEEINRRLVDRLSSVLFAPTDGAAELLRREGFAADAVHVTGNTVIDALLFARKVARKVVLEGLPEGFLDGRRMLLVTAHRRESFGSPFEAICKAILRIVEAEPDACVVYPVHLNPNVKRPVERMLGNHPRIALLRPAAYLEFVALLERAHMVLTDSGGVQEEAPAFRKPILVMREVTERPEGIAAGVACLVGTSEDRIVREALSLLRDDTRYRQMAGGANPYGDGRASERIAEVMERLVEGPSEAAESGESLVGGWKYAVSS